MRLLPVIPRLIRAERAYLTMLGLLVLVTAFLAAAVPGLTNDGYDRSVRDAVFDQPTGSADVIVQGKLPDLKDARLGDDAAVWRKAGEWRGRLPSKLRQVTTAADPWIRTEPMTYGESNRQIVAGRAPNADSRIRYTSGKPPGAPKEVHVDGRQLTRLDVSMAAAIAKEMRIKPGEIVAADVGLIVRVSGLYELRDPGDDYWKRHPELIEVEQVPIPGSAGDFLPRGTGLLDAASYRSLAGIYANALVSWRFPVTGPINASDASRLLTDLTELKTTAYVAEDAGVGYERGLSYTATSHLETYLKEFNEQKQTTQVILSLTFGGLFAVAAGVIALATRLALDRMLSTLSAVRARGGSLGHLGTISAGTIISVALPSAATGYFLALPLDSPAPFMVGAVLAVLATAIVPAAIGLHRHRRPGREARTDLTSTRPHPRRLVVEALVAVVCAVGVYALRRRGLAADGGGSGIDPLLSAVPVLAGLTLALVILRIYPYPMRAAGWLAARTRSTAAFIGIARAGRQSITTVLPMLVLVVATAMACFGGTISSGLRSAQAESAWRTVGADARADLKHAGPATIDRVRRSPGVREVVPALVSKGVDIRVDRGALYRIGVIAVDLDAYRRLVADSPMRPPGFSRGAGVPALLSPDLARTHGNNKLTLEWGDRQVVPLRTAGVIKSFPAHSAGEPFAVIPYDAVTPEKSATATTGMLLIGGGKIDAGALGRAVGDPEATVATRDRAERALRDDGMAGLIRTSTLGGAVVMGVYCLLSIVLSLIAGARARGTTVSYLRTLGLSHSQGRRMALGELLPALGTAVLAGWGLGLLLPHVLGPAINLRPYTGGVPVDDFGLDPLMTLLIAGGLLLFAGLAALADAIVAGRRHLGAVLRIGD